MHSKQRFNITLPLEWLHSQVVPAAKAMQADPSRAISISEVREHLAMKRTRTAK